MALPGTEPATSPFAGYIGQTFGARDGFGLSGVALLLTAAIGWRALMDRPAVAGDAFPGDPFAGDPFAGDPFEGDPFEGDAVAGEAAADAVAAETTASTAATALAETGVLAEPPFTDTA
jgi:hypothetical protein